MIETASPPRTWHDPGVCAHGVTLGGRCRHCPGDVALSTDLHRIADRQTSRAAARSVAPRVSRMQERVFAVLCDRGRMTHEALCDAIVDEDLAADLTPPTEQAIRTACARLVEAGAVVDSGVRVRTRRGRLAVLWEAAR